MNQEEILKNAYLTLGAIEIFRIIQEDMFDEIAIATPPIGVLVTALYGGLVDIQGDIIQLKETLTSNVPEIGMLQSSIEDLDPIIGCLSYEDDKGFVTDDVICNMDFIDWERLQMKIMIILEQAYQVIESLCRSTKPGIAEINTEKYK